jgi:cbb3-type cytochrome oxidase subunit 1
MTDASMPEQQPSPSTRLFLAFLAARLAYGLAFLVSAMRKSVVPWYMPLEHRFVWASQPDGLGMDWYGRTAVGFVAAGVTGMLAYGLSRRADWLVKPDVALSIARAGGLVLILDFVYFGWALMNQTPNPWPIPAWYCPR